MMIVEGWEGELPDDYSRGLGGVLHDGDSGGMGGGIT